MGAKYRRILDETMLESPILETESETLPFSRTTLSIQTEVVWNKVEQSMLMTQSKSRLKSSLTAVA